MATPEPRTPVTDSPRRAERRFYMSMGLFMILLIASGFGPSIAGPSNRNSPATALVIAHGIVLLAWMLLFLTQAALVEGRPFIAVWAFSVSH